MVILIGACRISFDVVNGRVESSSNPNDWAGSSCHIIDNLVEVIGAHINSIVVADGLASSGSRVDKACERSCDLFFFAGRRVLCTRPGQPAEG